MSQDEIVIDIDIDELSAVRTEFGEIDELDELTLKGRRRAVLDDLTDEVEVEDLTERDAEDLTEQDDDDDDDDAAELDPSGEEPLAADPDPSSAAQDDAPEPASASADEVTATAASAEDQPQVDADNDSDSDSSGESEGDKKKRRRRRRRKKAPVAPPELTCPPHKDFWEIWAGKFSAADFAREEDSKDAETDTDDDIQVETVRPAAPFAEPEVDDSSVPVIQDAPGDDALVRVGLNIGRKHGHKAAHVRALLRRVTGLHGKAVKDLTVRDQNSLFRMDGQHFETVVARLDGSVVDSIALTLVKMTELDADATPLRLPDEQAATMVAASTLADALDSSAAEPPEPAPEQAVAPAEPTNSGDAGETVSADDAVDRQPEASVTDVTDVTDVTEAPEPIAAGPEEG
ncbi:hypothetical protein DB30_08106 [Enhygromyxa salina]|uniref:Uncharacterized protein n=1 Tax=Enhygromyxa salina TaxID=215803 RepID=A0A0C1Z6T5_9BACT|nr:hypothetical protein DB30_08106 [Enhygromyxa salina]